MKEQTESDPYRHRPVSTRRERIYFALAALLLGFIVIHLFDSLILPMDLLHDWLQSEPADHFRYQNAIIYLLDAIFLAGFGLTGWFNGKYCVDRIKGFIHKWKFR